MFTINPDLFWLIGLALAFLIGMKLGEGRKNQPTNNPAKNRRK